MGSKILSLQFMRWFFHLMGNHRRSSCMSQCPFGRGMKGTTTTTTTKASSIKLIRTDGVVKIYEQPIQVSDLMFEFPKHMVCSSDSFYIGQKIPALSKHDQLQPGQSYFLLPNHLFQSVLSFVTITSFIASSQCQSDDHLKKALLSCQPFHIQKTPSGYLRVNVSEEFISQLMQKGKAKEDHHQVSSSVCTTLQLQKDYAQLVGPRQWKPKLETIKETREKRKMASACAMKRRSKKSQSLQSKKTQKSKGLFNQYSSSPSVSPKLISHNKIKAFLARSRERKQMI